MKAGRPQKAKHIKEAQGTLRPSREVDNPLTFEPLTVIPEPQYKINGEAKKYYEYVCNLLISNNVLTAAHIPDLTLAAYWWGIMTEARDNIESDGYTQMTQSGYTQITSHITVFEKATKMLQSFSDKYGLNLTASQKIKMPESKREDDLQKLLNG